MANYSIAQERAQGFYPLYDRKPEQQRHTHYCPGCGHGIVHKLIARAIDELGLQDRTVIISPVGCSVFTYYYLDVGSIQSPHGRAPAVATGVKRGRPESIVISYQGDGDLAAIGTAEILHAANRGESITVVFVNNAIYGMTGGQMAPTTLIGQKSTTTPFGRNVWNDGYPIRVCELLSSLEAPVYLERVALGDNKQIVAAGKALRRALENQANGLGFSLVEILSSCPTIWKMAPVEAQRHIREELSKSYPLGVYRDRTKDAPRRPPAAPPPPLADLPKILGLTEEHSVIESTAANGSSAQITDLRMRVAGFGGQGVLLLGEVLTEAGMRAGLEVSWLPSYGPEMRSGTSNCHIRLKNRAIDSPLIYHPNVLLALNEPSLRKFYATVEPGGWVLYNGAALPEGCARTDIRVLALPFSNLANALGESRAANMVMLGALLATIDMLPPGQIDGALKSLVKSERWLELDRRAIECGKNAAHAELLRIGSNQAHRRVR